MHLKCREITTHHNPYSCTFKKFGFKVRNSRTLASFSSWGNKHPKKASSKQSQLGCGTSSPMPSFHWSNQALATLFSWYATGSTLSVLTTCINSNTFFNSSTMFSEFSVVLHLVKLVGFILTNSRTLMVSAPSCRDPLCCPPWFITTWFNIRISLRNSTFVTSPCVCTSGALGNSCSSTFLLEGRLSLLFLEAC